MGKRSLKGRIFCIIFALVMVFGFIPVFTAAPVLAAGEFNAYNDCDGTSQGNVTGYTVTSGKTTGLLKDYSSGSNTPVTVTFSSSGSPSAQTGTYGGAETNSGTDAYNTFHDFVSMDGGIRYGSSGWYVDITFSGLDQAKTYTFATSANRDDSEYTDRITKFTVSGVDAAINASTSGVTVNNELSVSFCTGYNSVNGYVARWTDIQPGSDGSFKVRAEANSGTNAYPFSVFQFMEEGVSGPPPAAPNALTANAVSSEQINLTWNDNSSDESGFRIERKTGSGGTYAQIGTAAADAEAYSDTGLSSGTEYYYRVRAFNGGGNSAYSNEASATTQPSSSPVYQGFSEAKSGYSGSTPTGVTSITVNKPADTTDGDLMVALVSWDAASSTPSSISAPSGWTVLNEAKQTSGSSYVTVGVYYKIASSEGTSYTWSWTGSESVYACIMRITGFDAGNPINVWNVAGGNSNSPTSPDVTTTVSDTLVLRLYGADRAYSNAGYPSGHTGITRGSSGSGSLSGETNAGAAYKTQAAAGATGTAAFSISPSGSNPAWRALTIAISPAPQAIIAAPGELAASTVSDEQIDLTWTDNSADESGFRIERKTGSGGTYAQIGTAAADAETYSDTGLSSGTEYYYRVRAYNGGGNSAYSNEASATTITNNPPNQPELIAPLHQSTNIGTSPSLQVTVSDPEAENSDVTFYGRKSGTGASGEDFIIVAIPDTQNEATSYPAVFTSETQWISNNKDTSNIVFVTHSGDIVNTASSATEWQNADAAFDILDSAGVPYSVGPGNHDIGGSYASYFGPARFSGKSWYGGSYDTNNYDSYSLFSASGMDFIVINLRYNANSDILNWADALLKANPGRRGIVVQHDMLNLNNTWANQATFTALKDNPNLFLMLCGHMHSPSDGAAYREETGDDGHTIHVMLEDYQDYPSGGNGYMRILRFSPANDKIYATTYSPYADASITTNPDQMEMTYDMPDVSTFETIGTSGGIISGNNAVITWPGLDLNTGYEWYVKVTDGHQITTGPTWSFTTLAEIPPVQYGLTVNIVGNGTVDKNPNQTTYIDGATVTLTVNPATGWNFTGWSGDLSGNNNPETIVMNGNKTVTATFTEIVIPTYELSISVNPAGSGTVTGAGSYAAGTPVGITAAAAQGYAFVNWTAPAGSFGDANAAQTTFTMPAENTALTANFALIPPDEYALTVNIAGSGTVDKNPDQTTYTDGATVTLTANPATGWDFAGWSGNLSGNNNPETIVMNGNKTVTAAFEQITYTITATAGSNGSIDPSGVVSVNHGANQAFNISAASGYRIADVLVDGVSVGAAATYTFENVIAAHTIAATFAEIVIPPNQYQLTVNIAGSGTVNCNPEQATYEENTTVTMTATPASGWNFIGWSGDLSGNTNPENIVMNSAKSVTATFALDSSFHAVRVLPETVAENTIFEVTVQFTAPVDDFNSLGVADMVPDGWEVLSNTSWCTPAANTTQTGNNGTVEYIWLDTFPAGTVFNATYKVTVPAGTVPGTYTFPGGVINYYIAGNGLFTSPIGGDNEVGFGSSISGLIYSVNGTALSGATVELYLNGILVRTTTSGQSGQYALELTEKGDYTLVVSAASFINETQQISVQTLGGNYTLHFVGNHGLIPQSPNQEYVLACSNKWLYPPAGHPELALSMSKVLAVVNAWLP